MFMNNNNYRKGEEISQKLFELTGDPRYHNMRVGFENLRREKEKQALHDQEQGYEREM